MKSWGGLVVVENYAPVRSADLLAVVTTGGDWVRTCVDTANSIASGEWPVETMSTLLPRADCVHIKDFRFVAGPDGVGYPHGRADRERTAGHREDRARRDYRCRPAVPRLGAVVALAGHRMSLARARPVRAPSARGARGLTLIGKLLHVTA